MQNKYLYKIKVYIKKGFLIKIYLLIYTTYKLITFSKKAGTKYF